MSRASSPNPLHELLARGVGEDGVDRVLRIIRRHLEMDVAFISHFRAQDRVMEHVDDNGRGVLHVGQVIPLEEGYCLKVVRGELPQCIPDTSAVPLAAAIPATRGIPIGAHLSVPLQLENGTIYGTLCCFSHAPVLTLGARDMQMMHAFAEILAGRIEEKLAAERALQETGQAIRSAMEAGAPRIVFQPIHRIANGRLSGFECLSRFDAEPVRPPDQWFASAHEAGVGLELELHSIGKALTSLDSLPEHLYLSINSSPEMILSGGLARAFSQRSLTRVVLEITEHAEIHDYEALSAVLSPWRARGLRLAIDDAGAGYSSMRHILNLEPDIIKLDISLTHNVHIDNKRKALAKGLIAFAHDIGSLITAEGVEQEGELQMLRQLGADNVQGYLLGRPMPENEALALAA